MIGRSACERQPLSTWMRRALSDIRGELTWRSGHDFGV
jgi:hypothetical protein